MVEVWGLSADAERDGFFGLHLTPAHQKPPFHQKFPSLKSVIWLVAKTPVGFSEFPSHRKKKTNSKERWKKKGGEIKYTPLDLLPADMQSECSREKM